MIWSAKLSIALLTVVAVLQIGCGSRVAEKPLDNSQADGIKPVQLTDANFQTEVIESDLPVLVDMWAPWCGPCIEMKPTLRLVTEELTGQAKVAELNIDENPFIKEKYGIDRYPTLLIFRNGEEVDRLSGEKTEGELIEALSPFLSSSIEADDDTSPRDKHD
ncbi:thioredoxin family protein [Rubripirellula reticaptiva]|uniref:Thioredoxin-1 n=1 Tax=Rubripirellula reticaptiva TaxID=2528013 RepID=A0A5C6F8W3_9BACT|nr:thioredoxin domain-containing protein [Rubripirellula reticaptiva]TWU55951.1 Thioredoxin-1 [Rubripirellula reticaptiva]